MAKRKTQRGVWQPDFETLAYMLYSAHPIFDLIRRRPVIVVSVGLHARCENAGIERAADHNGDLLFLAERQETRQRLLFQKGITAREEENVEIARVRQPLGDLPFINPGSDCFD